MSSPNKADRGGQDDTTKYALEADDLVAAALESFNRIVEPEPGSEGGESPTEGLEIDLDFDDEDLEIEVVGLQDRLDARAEREIKTEAAEEGIEIEIEIDPGAFDVPEEVSAPPASPPDKAIQAENETLRGDQEALQQDLATLQDEHTSAQEEVSSLRRALKDKKDSIRVLDRKLRRMSEDQSALKSERDDLAGTLQMWEKMVGEMRTAAKQADEDHEKLRKRHKKELQDIQSLANEKLFKQIIPAVDNLDLAVKHAEGNNQASVDQVIEGIKMTAKHLFTSFEQAGLDRVPSEPGSLFDPAIHEAVERVEDDTQPAETIAVSLRPGFALKGRLIRPAQVSVYHGGPPARPAKPQAGDDAVAGEK